MTYRWPVVLGDRVAVAPHTDQFMEGLRFGEVTEIVRVAAVFNAQRYRVEFPGGVARNFNADDLLGAINPVPGKTGASPSTDPWDGKRDTNGDTYAEHMRKFNERQGS